MSYKVFCRDADMSPSGLVRSIYSHVLSYSDEHERYDVVRYEANNGTFFESREAASAAVDQYVKNNASIHFLDCEIREIYK